MHSPSLVGSELREFVASVFVLGLVAVGVLGAVRAASNAGWSRVGKVAAGIGGGVVASVAASFVVSATGLRDDTKATRADLLDELTEAGISDGDAECIADGLEDRFDGVDAAFESRNDARVVLQPMFACRGVDLGDGSVTDCFVDAIVDRFDVEGSFGVVELARVSRSLEADDRRHLAEASLECQGLTHAEAECTLNAMVAEFGVDLFDTERLELSTNQQAHLAELVADCANA